MSRYIDVSNPSKLTADDLQYLRDRGRLSEVAQLDHAAAIESAKSIPEANERIFALDQRIPSNRTPASVIEEIRERAATEDVEEVPPYSEWARVDLRRECAARDLPTTGKHADLVARLEENDQSGVRQ